MWSYISSEGDELNSYIDEMGNKINLEEQNINNLENSYVEDKMQYDRQRDEYERILRSLN